MFRFCVVAGLSVHASASRAQCGDDCAARTGSMLQTKFPVIEPAAGSGLTKITMPGSDDESLPPDWMPHDGDNFSDWMPDNSSGSDEFPMPGSDDESLPPSDGSGSDESLMPGSDDDSLPLDWMPDTGDNFSDWMPDNSSGSDEFPMPLQTLANGKSMAVAYELANENARAAVADTGRSRALVRQANGASWEWLRNLGQDAADAANILVGGFIKGAALHATDDLSDDDPLKNSAKHIDPKKAGEKATTLFREAVWEDVTSHTVEVCFFTFSKEGMAEPYMSKCNFGVSCTTCKYIKVEVRAGVDFCQGIKVHANAGVSALSRPFTATMDVLETFKMVVDYIPKDLTTVGLALHLAEAAMETIAENSGVDKYHLQVEFEVTFQYEIGQSTGATLDAKVGLDLCDSGWTCFGMEVSGSTGFKFGGKLFVCFSKSDGTIKIEIGAGPFTGYLILKYFAGLDPTFKVTPNNVGSKVVDTKQCMSKPEWRSQQQSGDDSLCGLVTEESKCNNAVCYWAEPNERRNFCFATKSWKDKYPGKQDGWCSHLPTETDCIKYLHCVWSLEPCENDNICKNMARLEHDLKLYATQKVCMATPQHLSQHKTQSDGLCTLADEKKCKQSGACYWSTRPQRRKGCFATTLWKNVHRRQDDGWCPFFTTAGQCNGKGICAWATHPCLSDPCGDDAKKRAKDMRVFVVR